MVAVVVPPAATAVRLCTVATRPHVVVHIERGELVTGMETERIAVLAAELAQHGQRVLLLFGANGEAIVRGIPHQTVRILQHDVQLVQLAVRNLFELKHLSNKYID